MSTWDDAALLLELSESLILEWLKWRTSDEQKRKLLDPKDFIFENLEGTEIWKMHIFGQQFIVRNCRKATIYLLDHMDTLTIDDCNKCKFIVGPVKGSVFLRNCKDCDILVACGQFRMRDCHNVNVFLCCPTQPIIESSRQIRFGCYQMDYSKLKSQFKEADLSVYNNSWYKVHDFTPSHGDTNWCLLPATTTVTDCFGQPSLNNMSWDKEHTLIPLTYGIYPNPSDDLEICLVVFFFNSEQEATTKLFIDTFYAEKPWVWLVSSRQLVLQPKDGEMVFGSTDYCQKIQNGPVIGLVWAGSRVISSCPETMWNVVESFEDVFMTKDPRTATIQAETFTSIASVLES